MSAPYHAVQQLTDAQKAAIAVAQAEEAQRTKIHVSDSKAAGDTKDAGDSKGEKEYQGIEKEIFDLLKAGSGGQATTKLQRAAEEGHKVAEELVERAYGLVLRTNDLNEQSILKKHFPFLNKYSHAGLNKFIMNALQQVQALEADAFCTSTRGLVQEFKTHADIVPKFLVQRLYVVTILNGENDDGQILQNAFPQWIPKKQGSSPVYMPSGGPGAASAVASGSPASDVPGSPRRPSFGDLP